QAFHYNKRRQDQDMIVVGDWVLIEANNRGVTSGKAQGGASKLKERFQGPYRVRRVLNKGRNCKLDLRTGDELFNNFHVSKLKIY
ncbi:hypothetical protein CROQUDRAFT_19298, partial [Cronartium quercuum f. sp. fusiforme G11]